jgi:hypothetical protein
MPSALLSTTSRTALLTLLAGALAGCSKGTDNNFTLFGPSTSAPTAAAEKTVETVKDCPRVEIAFDGGVFRVPGAQNSAGQDGQNVNYQFSITETARECEVHQGRLQMKVGLSGHVVLGPTGRPGTFSAPVRISILKGSQDAVVATKDAHATATVLPGRGEALFTLVIDPITVPFLRPEADLDYTIQVRFVNGGK